MSSTQDTTSPLVRDLIRQQEGAAYNQGDPRPVRGIFSVKNAVGIHAFWALGSRPVAERLQARELAPGRRTGVRPDNFPDCLRVNTRMILDERERTTSRPIPQDDGTLWRTYAIVGKEYNVEYHVHPTPQTPPDAGSDV